MTPKGSSLSFQVALRRWLDSPLGERSPWTLLALPVLAFVSFVVALVAAVRRARDDAARARDDARRAHENAGKRSFEDVVSSRRGPLVVCVGNIVMGGAGKSPVAQALLADLLAQGRTVALVARGYGAETKGVRAERADGVLKGDSWGDELKEHVWLLERAQGHEALSRCYVVQGASRARGLVALETRLQGDGFTPDEVRRVVVVLDDGLQHFGVRPHVRICVWPEEIYRRAPRAAFPLGPYREGFGALLGGGFGAFLRRFDVHVWSRVAPQETRAEKRAFAGRVRTEAGLQGAEAGLQGAEAGLQGAPAVRPLHLVAVARSEWLFPRALAAPACRSLLANEPIEAPDPQESVAHLDSALVSGRVGILCGLSSPDAFVRDVKHALAHLPVPLSAAGVAALSAVPTRFLPDHGVLGSEDEAWLSQFAVVVTSAKDASRETFPFDVQPGGEAGARSKGRLRELACNGHLWVLCVKVHFEDTQENPWQPARLLLDA
jgi:hypothetical protein